MNGLIHVRCPSHQACKTAFYLLCRPAVVISFAIAALSALLSALCYAEFATEVPITGGAFSYTTLTFGPLSGW